jgi:hypothetical protein
LRCGAMEENVISLLDGRCHGIFKLADLVAPECEPSVVLVFYQKTRPSERVGEPWILEKRGREIRERESMESLEAVFELVGSHEGLRVGHSGARGGGGGGGRKRSQLRRAI